MISLIYLFISSFGCTGEAVIDFVADLYLLIFATVGLLCRVEDGAIATEPWIC